MQGSVYREPGRDVPVVLDVDVVVAGAGTAGVFSAIASARLGCRTAMIDRFGYPGGNIGPGMVVGGSFRPESTDPAYKLPIWVYGGPAGIPKEFLERYAAHGGGAIPPFRRSGYIRDTSAAVHTAIEMLEEAGVVQMLSAYVGDPIVEQGRFKGVLVENKSGRQAVLAKVVIDDTGEADLSRRAGLEVLQPRASNHELDTHAPNGMGTWVVLGGIDCHRFQTLQKEPVKVPEKDLGELGRITGGNTLNTSYLNDTKWFDRKAGLAGFRLSLKRPDSLYDPADGMHISELEKQVRLHGYEIAEYLRLKVPGFEEVYVITIAPFLGVRGGPCIQGQYTMTTRDCREGRKFDDVVLVYGEGRALEYTLKKHGHYLWADVPYRVMLPKGAAGMLAVGRNASCIPDTLLRQRLAAMELGQVGGAAAALSVKNDLSPHELPVRDLQSYLLEEGFYLGDRRRLSELGLA